MSHPAQPNDVECNVCLAHKNEHSDGYALETIAFASPVNTELGKILEHNHKIQVQSSHPLPKLQCTVVFK